jgi:SAM-dependent methyltransferase
MDASEGLNWAEVRALNRARWDCLAEVHGQDAYYDAAALIAGADTLTVEEEEVVRAAVGDIAGLDVLRVQCHIGFDSISLARRGAKVTGTDFSAASLDKARRLADQCGVQVEWVEADSTELPTELAGRFDLAYATAGVICWIQDMVAWMRSVYSTLRPGGQLVLLDFHPLSVMLDSTEPLVFAMPYANDGGHFFEEPGSYAAPGATLAHQAMVQYSHSLGEVVTAAASAGFVVDELVERGDVSARFSRGVASHDSDGRWRLRVAGEALPLVFALRATRPL